jgi:hypothetical protein
VLHGGCAHVLTTVSIGFDGQGRCG